MKGKTIAVGLAAALCLAAIGIVAIVGITGAYNANLTSEQSKLSAAAQVTAAFVAKEMGGVGELEKPDYSRIRTSSPPWGPGIQPATSWRTSR